ncbi:MAG: hypothetical protein JWN46_3386 [Acidimicrobiales bacterium]|nr:hypothetical protein [Acidimicrobiales bacterium]
MDAVVFALVGKALLVIIVVLVLAAIGLVSLLRGRGHA